MPPVGTGMIKRPSWTLPVIVFSQSPAPPELVGSAPTLVNCIGFSITVASLSLLQWIAAMVPPQYLLVLLTAGP